MATVTNKTRTNVYLDLYIKNKAQAIFNQYGICLSDAINIFLAQTVLEKGIPFQIKIPNIETKEAILDAKTKVNMSKILIDTLKKEIDT